MDKVINEALAILFHNLPELANRGQVGILEKLEGQLRALLAACEQAHDNAIALNQMREALNAKMMEVRL